MCPAELSVCSYIQMLISCPQVYKESHFLLWFRCSACCFVSHMLAPRSLLLWADVMQQYSCSTSGLVFISRYLAFRSHDICMQPSNTCGEFIISLKDFLVNNRKKKVRETLIL